MAQIRQRVLGAGCARRLLHRAARVLNVPRRRSCRIFLPLAVCALLGPAPGLDAQKFYPDDPVWRMPVPISIEKARSRKLSDYYDFFRNTFARPGERVDSRACNVNTVDEVPDSGWFVNRPYPPAVAQAVRGPGTDRPPRPPFTVVKVKTEGVTPGFEIDDAAGARYYVKFDPRTNPEMATAADVIGSKFFHALGYHVPQNYIVYIDPERLAVSPKATLTDQYGKKRSLSSRDVDEILLDVPKQNDGRHRAVASLALEGTVIGPFRFHGMRRDDPNDWIPHEHRRELRGLFVFAAWLEHEDSRAINTLDTIVEEDGRRYIRHHLMDFGSILGSASVKANSPRSGNEYLFAFRPALAQLFSLGLWVPLWARADYPDLPSVGRFEYRIFEPEKWKPEYPNPAFLNRLPDDTFWAAKRVMAFSDELIRAIVRTGEYSDPRAEDWVVRCLIERRNRVGRAYFKAVLPLDGFRVDDGRLLFDDLEVKYGFAESRSYDIRWRRMDNASGKMSELQAAGPAVPRVAAEYLAAIIEGAGRSLTVYLRKGREVVGIERYHAKADSCAIYR
ncbi:MAG: hypothetical protein IT158_08325 [Bryobacterales bacterium]|nr:hypothetical protein [Bryobacterales bacterium]